MTDFDRYARPRAAPLGYAAARYLKHDCPPVLFEVLSRILHA